MDEIVLTRDDNGSNLSLDVGDIVKVILQENPTTGYTWQVDGQLPIQLKESMDQQKKTYKGSAGGAGKRILSYQVESKGSGMLSLKYWQPWSGDESITERFTISFEAE